MVHALALDQIGAQIVGFGAQIEPVLEVGELETEPQVVGRLPVGLDVVRSRQREHDLVVVQVVDSSLMRGNRALGHEGHPGRIQQRGNAQIVAERLLRHVHVDSRAVEHAQVIFPFASQQAVHHHAQIESRGDRRRGRVQAAVHVDRRGQRGGQHGEKRFAQRDQIGLAERRLELADAEADLILQIHVDPRLLQQRASALGRVQRQVERQLVERPARNAQNGVGNLEAAVRYVVLIVQPELLVVVPVELAGRLEQHVGLEHEIARARLEAESFLASHRDHGAFDVFVRLVVRVLVAVFRDLSRRRGRCREQGQ